MSLHQELAVLAQRVFPTVELQVLGTLGVLLAVVLFGSAVRRLGTRLHGYVPVDDVEAVEAAVVTGFAVLAGGAIVYIWRAQAAVASAFTKLPDPSPENGVLALVAVLALGVGWTLTRISRSLLEDQGVGEDYIGATRREAIHHVLQLTIFGFVLVFIVALAGVAPGDLLLGAGAIGVVVGFAARQTLGSVFAGFVILFARPFDVGDWVVIDDQDGIVRDISLFNTQLRTWDGEHVVIPNDRVSGTDIINRSREGRLRISIDVGVDYDADIERASSLARDAMRRCESVLDQPAPAVVMKRFGDSAVVLECRFWIDDPSARRQWTAQTEVVGAIKEAFDDEGVTIPFPQRTVSGREDTTLQTRGGQQDEVWGTSE